MKYVFLIFLSLLFSKYLEAQEAANDSTQLNISDTTGWSFAAAAYYYAFPFDDDLATLLGYADYKSIHFEARYNYEDKNTASVFGGYRLETGSKVLFGATPLLGAVFGNTNGIAPGLLLDLAWKNLDFYSESEYVFDFTGKENNYLYTWSELAITPFNNFRTGISANRTRLYQTELDLQRAAFIQYSIWKATAGVYYFNPFTSDNFLIATLSFEF